MTLSKHQFIQKEIAEWGEAEIFDWIEKGIYPVLTMDETGRTKWTWKSHVPTKVGNLDLTNGYEYATVGDRRRNVAVSPVSVAFRANE